MAAITVETTSQPIRDEPNAFTIEFEGRRELPTIARCWQEFPGTKGLRFMNLRGGRWRLKTYPRRLGYHRGRLLVRSSRDTGCSLEVSCV
jgi:hypothetical protein